MTLYIHYSDGKQSVKLHNVASVECQGPRMVRVRMMFSDFAPTHDHVKNIAIIPETEE